MMTVIEQLRDLNMYRNYLRLKNQALAISELLRTAGLGPCSLTEGVAQLIQQRDELLAALEAEHPDD